MKEFVYQVRYNAVNTGSQWQQFIWVHGYQTAVSVHQVQADFENDMRFAEYNLENVNQIEIKHWINSDE